MMKHEFEQAYGRKVTDKRWLKIEAAYMESGTLDRLDFVAELKAQEAAQKFHRQAAKGFLEIQRFDVTEAQFRSYIRTKLKGHALEAWRVWVTPEIGHGDWEYRQCLHENGTIEINKDCDGEYQTYAKDASGNCYNLIYEFSPHDDDGKGSGYFFLCDNNVERGPVAANCMGE